MGKKIGGYHLIGQDSLVRVEWMIRRTIH